MTLEQRVEKLEELYANLSESFIQAQKNQVVNTAKTDDNANKVDALTPYTETQIGYYGETEKTFYNVPEGNVTVFGLNAYTLNRVADRLTLTFSALTEQTEITISIL